MNREKILEIYYDHYKETYALSKKAQERRNKNFVLLCILEVISFLMIWNPSFICGLLNDAVKLKLENTIQISNSILQTFVWILLAYVLIRYVQDVMYIERQYGYIDKLENEIAGLLEKDIFSREGDGYLKDYPLVLNIVDLFYKMFCPVFFAGINIYHIIQEWNISKEATAPLIADTIISISIFIITLFFFFEIHSKIRNWFLKCKPIGFLDKIIRGWLKEV